MNTENTSRVRKLLRASRWSVLFLIILLGASSSLLGIAALIKMYQVISACILHLNYRIDLDLNAIAAQVLGIIDVCLLIVVQYIFAIGLYKLFIGPFTSFPWLDVHSMDDLKIHIAKMIVVFLSIFAVQKIVEWQDPIKIAYFGAVIALIGFILIWFSRGMDHHRKDEHEL